MPSPVSLLAPDEFAELLDTPEFNAMPAHERAAVFDAGLKDSEEWLRSNGMADAEAFSQTAAALGVRYRPAQADIELSQQTPLGTVWNAVKNVGPELAGMVGGGMRFLDKGAEVLADATGTERGGLFGGMARQLEGVQDEGRVLRPLNPANPTAATLGQGAAQAIGLIGTAAASAPALGARALTVVPAALGFGAGAGEGIRTAEQMGITSPAGQLGMGAAFGATEAATEAIGGIGGKLLPVRKGLAGAVQNIATEGGEEVLAGTMQDAITRAAGVTVADAQNPNQTVTGYELPQMDAAMLERRKQEAIGGMAGGAVFSAVQLAAGNPSLPSNDNVSTNQTPAAPAPEGAARGSMLDIALRAGMENPAPPKRQPILTGVPDGVPPFRDRPLNQGVPEMAGDVVTDLRIPRSPEAIAESQRIEQERQAKVAEMRMLDARATGMPMIPDSPTGSRDILDWANENPIYLPPGFSEDRKLPEYEALSRNPLPPYWRQFVASGKRGGNPDDIASRAYDKGLIDAPTADAYLAKLQEGIGARKQYRVQFQQREKDLAQEERRVVDFEKTQDKLAKKPQAQEVPFDEIVTGDRMTIDGEQAVVKAVEYNEDGYLTNVVIEDGKRFGLMQFDPQTRGGLLVDEYQPRGTTASTPATGRAGAAAATNAEPQAASPTSGGEMGTSAAMAPGAGAVNLEDLNAELQIAGGRLQFSLAPLAAFTTKAEREYAFGDGSYTHPVTLKDGRRLSGETHNYNWKSGEPVFFGYTRNGDLITLQARYVTPEMIATSRDGNRTASNLRDRLTLWRQRNETQGVRFQLSAISPGTATKATADAVKLLAERLPHLTNGKLRTYADAAAFLADAGYHRGAGFTSAELAALEGAEAFYDNLTGSTVVLLNQIGLREGETPIRAVARVLLHERVGHEGVNALLKDSTEAAKWDKLAARIPQAELDGIASEPGYTHLAGDRGQLALEWLARQTERIEGARNAAAIEGGLSGVAKQLWQALKELLGKVFANFSRSAAQASEVAEIITRARQAQMAGTALPMTAEAMATRLQMTYAGAKAEMPQFMRDSLETAQTMAAAGKDAETIRALTGWFPGKYDGKMRWEIPDDGAKWNYNPDRTRMVLNEYSPGMEMPLRLVLNHPALFEAYPMAIRLRVKVSNDLPPGDGVFDNGVIELSSDPKDQMNTLLHEIQHWIQEQEGFATGSAPTAFSLKQTYTDDTIQRSITFLQTEGVSADPLEDYGFANEADYVSLARSRGWEGPTRGVVQRPYDQYRRVAGEIESRDVEARQFLTPEQRKATAPYSSENIAPESAIVLMQPSGLQMSMNPLHKAGTPFEVSPRRLALRTILTGSPLPRALKEVVMSTDNERKALDASFARIGDLMRVAAEGVAARTGTPLADVYAQVNAYLEGQPGAQAVLMNVDEGLAEASRRARNMLDDMTQAIANTLPNSDLKATMIGNMGSWMRRGYAAFDEASGWNFKGVLAAARAGKQLGGKDAARIMREAAAFLEAQDATLQGQRDASGLPREGTLLHAEMKDLMDRDMWAAAMMGGAGVRKNTSSLMRRKDIPGQLRALMGEETNPLRKYAASGAFQAQFLARHQGQIAMRQLGLAQGLFQTQRGGDFNVEIPKDVKWSGMAGLWTTPELWAALQATSGTDLMGAGAGGMLLQGLYWLSNMAKLNRVALNPKSWAPNIYGGLVSLVQSGDVLDWHFMRRVGDAMRTMQAGKAKASDVRDAAAVGLKDAQRSLLSRLQAGGVINSNVMLRDIAASLPQSLMNFIERTDYGDKARGAARGALLGNALARSTGGPLSLTRAAGIAAGAAGGAIAGEQRIQNVEQKIADFVLSGPDNLVKITGWLRNYEVALAAGMNAQQAEAQATERTLNTFPNYARLPALAREASRLGVIGSFVAFQVEVLRNYGHNWNLATRDLRSGNAALQADAMRRMIGLSSVTALAFGGLSGALTLLLGSTPPDDERNKKWRKWFAAPWEKDALLHFNSYDENGVSYFNPSYLVPQTTMAELVETLNQGLPPEEAAQRFLGRLWEQYGVGSSVHVSPLLAALTNQNRAGRPITYREGVAGAVERADYAAKVIADPGAASLLTELVYALQSKEVDGKTYTVEQLAKQLAGMRVQTQTWDHLLEMRYKAFSADYQNARAEARRQIKTATSTPAQAMQWANTEITRLQSEVKAFEADLPQMNIPAPKAKTARKNSRLGTLSPVELTKDGKGLQAD